MEAIKDYGDQPSSKDFGTLMLLAAMCPLGLLVWVGLFMTIHWSLLAAWTAAIDCCLVRTYSNKPGRHSGPESWRKQCKTKNVCDTVRTKIWEEAGRPEGQHDAHWERACRESKRRVRNRRRR